MSIDLATQWQAQQNQCYSGPTTDLCYGQSTGWTCQTCHCWVSPWQSHNCVFYQFPVFIVPWVSQVPIPVQPVVAKSPADEVREALRALEVAIDRLVSERSLRREAEETLRRITEKLADIPDRRA